MAARKTDPVLSLTTTLADRAQVEIDGRLYPLRSMDEFSIFDFQRQAEKYRRLGRMFQSKHAVTAKDQKEQDALLDELCRLVLEAPDAVHKKLRTALRLQIVTVFSALLRKNADAAGIAGAARAPRKGFRVARKPRKNQSR